MTPTSQEKQDTQKQKEPTNLRLVNSNLSEEENTKPAMKLSTAHLADFIEDACDRLDSIISRLPQPTADRFRFQEDPVEDPTDAELMVAQFVLLSAGMFFLLCFLKLYNLI